MFLIEYTNKEGQRVVALPRRREYADGTTVLDVPQNSAGPLALAESPDVSDAELWAAAFARLEHQTRFAIAYPARDDQQQIVEPRIEWRRGGAKALVVGVDSILAIGPLHTPDEELWRQGLAYVMGNKCL